MLRTLLSGKLYMHMIDIQKRVLGIYNRKEEYNKKKYKNKLKVLSGLI